MFTYGKRSREKLATCHPDIVLVAELALDISPYDIAIIHGWRGEEFQNALVESGVSRTRWPTSKHNHIEDGQPCSLAIDFAPWVGGEIPWNDTHFFKRKPMAAILPASVQAPDFPSLRNPLIP